MSSPLVVCPACGHEVATRWKPLARLGDIRQEPDLRIGLHTRRDGSGQLCAGVGLRVGETLSAPAADSDPWNCPEAFER